MEEIYTQWRASLRPKQRKRTYKHFDESLDLDNEKDFEFIIQSLKNLRAHHFLPLIKFIKRDIRYRRDENRMPKRGKKERPIMFASHLDAHIYSFYANQWAKKYEAFCAEKNIGESAIAYRKIVDDIDTRRGKNNINFAKEVFEYIKNTNNCSLIIADISKFFDTLNHKILKERVTTILGARLSNDEYKILRSLTSFRYILNSGNRKKKDSIYEKLMSQVAKRVKKGGCSLAQAVYESGRGGVIKENRTTVGIPQGSPLSGLLANIYMSLFDFEFINKFCNVLYRRYSDDIAIVCPILETQDILHSLQEFVTKCALKINPTKIFIATFKRDQGGSMICAEVKDGFGKILGRKSIDYLGFEFNGQTVQVRGTTMQKAYRKADRKIRKFQERQTSRNPGNKHQKEKNLFARKNSAYIGRAEQLMVNVGVGIKSQQKKFSKFVRKRKIIVKN